MHGRHYGGRGRILPPPLIFQVTKKKGGRGKEEKRGRRKKRVGKERPGGLQLYNTPIYLHLKRQ